MKAVLLRRFGGPDVLEVTEVPKPSIRATEVLIRINAAGVNYFEILMRQGRYGFRPSLPMAPGVEIAGIVEEAGKDAGIAIGSRVAVPLFALGKAGGYAEFVAVEAEAVHIIPETLRFGQAAALMVQGLTALHAMRRVSPDAKTVLILAAAGGVGSLLVQMARRRGARRIIAAVGSERKIDIALGFGADAGVVYQNADWGDALKAAANGQPIGAIYDFVGGPFSNDYLPALAPEGELLLGALGRAEIAPTVFNDLVGQNQTIRGMALLPLLTKANLKADLAELFALSAADKLRVPIGAQYALEDVAAAHSAIEARETVGKVILLP